MEKRNKHKPDCNVMSQEPLTIVFMNSIGKDVWRGGEKWMVNAAAGLNERGHNVYCIGKTGAVWLSKAASRRIKVIGMNIHADFDPMVIGKLYFFFKKVNVSILCCNFEKDVRLGGIAGRLAGVPSIFVRKGLSLIYEKWRYRMAYKYIVNHIVTPANFIKNQFKKFSWIDQNNIHVIHNGVELPDVSQFDREKILTVAPGIQRPVLLGAGSLFSQKGFEYLIEAIHMLNAKNLFPHVVIAGDGDPAPYRKIAQELNVDSYIHFAGHRNDLQELMYGADCFVLSSIDEGLPNVVLEAMSTGTPVVAADAGGTNEIIADGINGYIVPIKNSTQLAEKIRLLLENSDRRQEIGERGRDTVRERFTIKYMVDTVEELFRTS